jgi:hypothetical protein
MRAHRFAAQKAPMQGRNMLPVELFTQQDIRLFQSLPDLPPLEKADVPGRSLSLRGKANLEEVMKHFSLLEREGKRVLKGYALPLKLGNTEERSPADLFAHCFQDMRAQDKCYLFTLYDALRVQRQPHQGRTIKEVHLYLLPVCAQTMYFCQQMGALPPPECTHAIKPYTFCFFINVSKHAIYSQMEKSMLTRSEYPSLNPTPIAYESVKMEPPTHQMVDDYPMQQEPTPGIMPDMPQMPGPGQTDPTVYTDEAQIDALIQGLRNQPGMDFGQIMQAIQPFVNLKVSRAVEAKLNAFMEELIERRKQETVAVQAIQIPAIPPQPFPP